MKRPLIRYLQDNEFDDGHPGDKRPSIDPMEVFAKVEGPLNQLLRLVWQRFLD
jgi:hypothetical protein